MSAQRSEKTIEKGLIPGTGLLSSNVVDSSLWDSLSKGSNINPNISICVILIHSLKK
jgi:hypothetical protein